MSWFSILSQTELKKHCWYRNPVNLLGILYSHRAQVGIPLPHLILYQIQSIATRVIRTNTCHDTYGLMSEGITADTGLLVGGVKYHFLVTVTESYPEGNLVSGTRPVVFQPPWSSENVYIIRHVISASSHRCARCKGHCLRVLSPLLMTCQVAVNMVSRERMLRNKA